MITQEEIEEYFTNIQCAECPFSYRCGSLCADYDAPTLCDCVTGNFEQPSNHDE